jgi:hypothetical protein
MRALWQGIGNLSTHLFALPFCYCGVENNLQRLHSRVRWPTQPRELLSYWTSLYRGTFKNNQLFKALYKALPKYICWKIWLARNRIIFSNLHSPPDLVAKKVVGLLAEFFLSKSKPLSFTPTSTLESDWICSIPPPPPFFHQSTSLSLQILLAAS